MATNNKQNESSKGMRKIQVGDNLESDVIATLSAGNILLGTVTSVTSSRLPVSFVLAEGQTDVAARNKVHETSKEILEAQPQTMHSQIKPGQNIPVEADDFSYITDQSYTCNPQSFVNCADANVQITKQHLETISNKGFTDWLDITLVYYYARLVK